MSTADANLSALDWIAVGLVAIGCIALATFPVTFALAFERMFRDFGSVQLPWLTRHVLTLWFAPLLAAPPLVATVAALGSGARLAIGARRALIVGAFFAALASLALCVYGCYLPIWQVADRVHAG